MLRQLSRGREKRNAGEPTELAQERRGEAEKDAEEADLAKTEVNRKTGSRIYLEGRGPSRLAMKHTRLRVSISAA